MITDKNEKTMNCGFESCRFNEEGECCNDEAYQKCVSSCNASYERCLNSLKNILGEDFEGFYQRFKEWEREKNGSIAQS